jgi:hypothetical protein
LVGSTLRILRQSLIADLATPMLLLAQLTRFTRSNRVSSRTVDRAPG